MLAKKNKYDLVIIGVGAFCTMGGLRMNMKNQFLDYNGDTYEVNVPGSEAGYCIYSGRNAVFNLIK